MSHREPAAPASGTPARHTGGAWAVVALLLGIGIVVPLLVFLYDSETPTLFGFPFFYWFQFAMIPVVCRGGPDAGPIGELPERARFRWLVSPRSTIVQTSPVHTGRTHDPAARLAHLMDTVVRRASVPSPPTPGPR